ncbi:DUF3800 domain-containing protein [Croceicoccus mobilis]|uniref:DUF3800 domain-containing protein n=1 Tax=Croceicoccus mobilis TaxID=1703339 RepID=A0A917DX58_9SPHN|nr:DUF3800 domain-containing protein [Croceicoccus mobilis]GGD78525.1 hypothetical protein GCM10010990_30470 [Croceicoccus mobilis]
MAAQYIIYCDESDSKGRFYSHFYGGALIEASKQQALHAELQEVKDRLGIREKEIKWQRITQPYADKYIEFVNAIFDIVKRGDIKFRIMFTQNRHVRFLDEYQVDNEYFLLYYQFIKHAFGLEYAGDKDGASINVLLDDIPHNREKFDQFKEYLASLSTNPRWRRAGVNIPYEAIADVDSKRHNVLQALDVVLGGIQSRLNEKHTRPIPPAKRRAKRAVAKERVYKAIKDRIFELYPHFNVGISTGEKNGSRDRFDGPYRHWLFIPNGSIKDETRTKKAAGLRK